MRAGGAGVAWRRVGACLAVLVATDERDGEVLRGRYPAILVGALLGHEDELAYVVTCVRIPRTQRRVEASDLDVEEDASVVGEGGIGNVNHGPVRAGIAREQSD